MREITLQNKIAYFDFLSLTTHIRTLVRFLARVHPSMLPERPIRGKCLGTQVTRIRPLASVGAHVDQQHGGAEKGLFTDLALMRSWTGLFAHVAPQMHAQVVQTQESLLAHIALVGLLLRYAHALGVDLVPVQVVAPLKLRATLDAHKLQMVLQMLLQHFGIHALDFAFVASETLRN